MKIIKIQSKDTPEGVTPYPYFIFRDGKVGVQKYWKGNPSELMGFSKGPVTGKMEINVRDFFFYPAQVLGMYPIFKTAGGSWFTNKDAIKSVQRVRFKKLKKK